jgi:hypothetical protein
MGELSPLIRILLRYVAGYLVFRQMLPPELADLIANDPQLAAMIGGGIVFCVEGFYVLARKFGWKR